MSLDNMDGMPISKIILDLVQVFFVFHLLDIFKNMTGNWNAIEKVQFPAEQSLTKGISP